MTTIYIAKTARVSVADAKRLISDAAPRGEAVDIFASVDEQGNIDFDSPIETRLDKNANITGTFIDADFPKLCARLGIVPTNLFRPALTDYPNVPEIDEHWTIAHDEFVKLAALHGLFVEIGHAPAPDETAPAITFASFGKSAFMQLIRHEEKRLMAHEVRADGVYVRAPDASDMRMGLTEPPAIHPTGDYDAPALPFPFTLAQFLAFEKTAGIVGQMHDDEIAALKDKTPMPYQLARAARYVEAGGNVNDLMQTPEPQAPPVGAESASGKRWTPERLDELRQYRTKHGTKNAAEHFGISAARVRELLPSGKPKATPFAGLIHRIN